MCLNIFEQVVIRCRTDLSERLRTSFFSKFKSFRPSQKGFNPVPICRCSESVPGWWGVAQFCYYNCLWYMSWMAAFGIPCVRKTQSANNLWAHVANNLSIWSLKDSLWLKVTPSDALQCIVVIDWLTDRLRR